MKKKFSELSIRDVLVVNFPKQDPPTHLQTGIRTAIVITPIVEAFGEPRFDFIEVVPTTKYMLTKKWWVKRSPIFYPILPRGVGGLRYDSIVLLDQSRPVYLNQIIDFCGRLTPDEYSQISKNLQIIYKSRILSQLNK